MFLKWNLKWLFLGTSLGLGAGMLYEDRFHVRLKAYKNVIINCRTYC